MKIKFTKIKKFVPLFSIFLLFGIFQNLYAIKPIDSLLFNDEQPESSKTSNVQVRILLQLEPQKQVSIKTVSGKDLNVFRPTDNIVHMIRASVNQTENFYVDGWHIENIPLSFDHLSSLYSSKLTFFKIYNHGSSQVEELWGSTIITGRLEKQDKDFYNLIGENTSVIYNQDNTHQLNIIAGIKDVSIQKSNIATKPSSSNND